MLRARRNFSVKQKFTTLLAVLVLAIQPLYGVLSSTVANATPVVAGDVVINEIKPSSTSGDERWVELYNTTGSEIDLSNWRVVRSGTNFGGIVSSGTVAAHGFYVLESTSATLPQVSSTPIELWNGPTSSGVKIDEVSYSGVAAGQSYGRTADGISTFAVFSAPTKGVSNVVAVTPPSTVNITNVAELRAAIENQADGQTWNISAGQYGLAPFTSLTVSGQTGWYFPITANNLTINGVGNPTIYGTGYTANGNWSTQNLVSVFGDNVTIDGLTFMPKIEPNKTIEVLGNDFTLRNSTIAPNTLTNQSEYDNISDPDDPSWTQDAKQWGGSLYFSHEGNHTVQNVTIHNAGISFRYSPSGTHISFDNVQIVDTTAVDWINNYRYSSGFNNTAGSSISGVPKVVYHVTSSLDNFQMALDSASSGDVVELDSDITAAQELNVVNDGVTINGNGHTIGAGFNKTGNDNNSLLGIKSDNVVVNNLKVDAGSATNNLHGVNIYQASGVVLNNITANNGNAGVIVNSSTVTIDGIHTSGNRWYGVNVDKTGAELTIKGANSHSEAANLYVDDRSVGKINDVDHKYMIVASGNADIYTLDTIKPTITLNSPAGGAYNPTSYQLTANDNNKLAIVTGNLYNGSTLVKSCSARDMDQATYTLDCAVPSTLADGTYTIRYNAKDVAGNMSTTSTSTFVIDRTAPDVPAATLVDSNGANVANSGYIKTKNFTFTLPSGVARYQLKYWNDIQGSAFSGETKAWNPSNISGYMPTSTTYKDNFTQGEGKHYFAFSACDAAGNCSAYSAPFVVTYDKTAPNVSIVSPEDGAIVNGGPLQKWTTTTPTDVDHYIYESYTGNSTSSALIYAQTLKSTQRNVGGLQNITFWWRVGAVDKAGNTAWTELREMIIDNKAPTATVTYSNNGAATNQDVTVTLTTSEPIQTPDGWTKVDDTAYTLAVADNGSYSVGIKDLAGNETTLQYEVSGIDKVAPVVTLDALTSTTSKPTITGTVDDMDAVVVVTIGGTDYAATNNGDGTWSYTLADALVNGDYTVTVTATDAVGNATTETGTITVAVPPAQPTSRTVETESVTLSPLATTEDTTTTGTDNGATGTNTTTQTTDNATTTDNQDKPAVLGTETTKDDSNTESTKDSVVEKGWELLGLAWYWWLAAIAAIAAILWFIAAVRRRKHAEE